MRVLTSAEIGCCLRQVLEFQHPSALSSREGPIEQEHRHERWHPRIRSRRANAGRWLPQARSQCHAGDAITGEAVRMGREAWRASRFICRRCRFRRAGRPRGQRECRRRRREGRRRGSRAEGRDRHDEPARRRAAREWRALVLHDAGALAHGATPGCAARRPLRQGVQLGRQYPGW